MQTVPKCGALISVQGLTKYYDERPAIVDVTFSVPRGQILGFLGPNGAGKSTTMRILTGYLGATGGTATVAGFDVFSQSREVRRRIGYLPELNPLYPELRVDQHLALACRLRGVAPSRRRARIDTVIDACGLGGRRRDVIGRLSKGLRQRVGLAQAIVHEPEVLILDEPTAGLDPRQTRETRDLIRSLGGRHTIVLSSHVLSEVQASCERVVILDQGRIVADDTPAGLSRRLGEGRRQQVEATVQGEREAIEACLADLPAVNQVKLQAGQEDWLVLVNGSGADLEDQVARAVVGAGLKLRSLKSASMSLEEVFLKVTKGGRRR